MTRVLCVDDHPVVRRGLAALIDAEADMRCVGEAATAGEALSLLLTVRPDVVLMDVRLKGEDGIEATGRLLAAVPRLCVLMVTTYDGDEVIHRALAAGARGYVLKEFAQEELLTAIRALRDGRRYIPAEVALRLVSSGPRIALTEREHEVLEAMADGLRNKQIGARLSISEGTVRTHVQNLLEKFDCHDRGRAIAIAIARGFLMPGGAGDPLRRFT